MNCNLGLKPNSPCHWARDPGSTPMKARGLDCTSRQPLALVVLEKSLVSGRRRPVDCTSEAQLMLLHRLRMMLLLLLMMMMIRTTMTKTKTKTKREDDDDDDDDNDDNDDTSTGET